MIKYKIILIGGNRDNEDYPLKPILKFFKDYKFDFEFITSNIHLHKSSTSKLIFKDYLKLNKIKTKVINSHNRLFLYLKKKNHNVLILLIHSTFIINNNIINQFKKRIFNYHIGSLPQQRGGAPGTWQTLMSKKSTNMTIHRVTNKIDSGDIMLTKKINIKKNQSLKDFYNTVQTNEYNFFRNFFRNFKKNKIGKKQNKKQSNYMPRLNTNIHGYINWSWSGEEIYNFIRSFDHPFAGAKTFLDGKEVVIRDVKLLKKYNFHPFQKGIIFKKEKNLHFIACEQFAISTDNIKIKKSRKSLNNLLGKRLYTPYSILDNSMTALSVQKPYKSIVKKVKVNCN